MSSDVRARPALIQYLGIAFLVALAMASLASPFKGRIASYGPIHDGAHVLAFCTAFLLNAPSSRSRRARALWGVALLLFGVTLELSERSIYGNGLEYFDIFDDTVGIMLGCLFRKAVKG